MKCKAGDRVIVTRSKAGNEGRILTVLRYVGAVPGYFGSDRWETDTLLNSVSGSTGLPLPPSRFVQDSCVVPLPDLPETETNQETACDAPRGRRRWSWS
jgi:hypothetical protein